jgi:hypothetical protein
MNLGTEDSAVALSPHESIDERIEALRNISKANQNVVKRICKDDTQPSRLRIVAIELLEVQSSQEQEECLACALACYVPKNPVDLREVAIKVAQSLIVPNFLDWIESQINIELERYLLLAIWGYGNFCGDIETFSSETPTLTLLDMLVSLATKDFLRSATSKNELMGSYRTEALAALCIMSLAVLCDLRWVETALYKYHVSYARTAAINIMSLDENCKFGSNKELLAVVLCQSLENVITGDDTLRKWNSLWYHGVAAENDENATKTRATSLKFAHESTYLLIMLQRLVRQWSNVDYAVASRIAFIMSSWCAVTPEEGICLPWNTPECSKIAKMCLEDVIEITQNSNILYDCGVLRERLSKDAWKTDWVGSGALIFLCINFPKYGSFENADANLLANLLPMVDEIDPRISGPTWNAIDHMLSTFTQREAALLFRSIERNLATQDPAAYRSLMVCLDHLLRQFDDEATFEEHDLFIERLTRDAYYSASTNPALYEIAVTRVLCTAVERRGLFVVRLLPSLLSTIKMGAQRRNTKRACLTLLECTLKACKPRISAHRGEVFEIFLRLSVNVTDEENVWFQNCLHLFRKACEDNNRNGWIDAQIDKIRGVNPAVAARFE